MSPHVAFVLPYQFYNSTDAEEIDIPTLHCSTYVAQQNVLIISTALLQPAFIWSGVIEYGQSLILQATPSKCSGGLMGPILHRIRPFELPKHLPVFPHLPRCSLGAWLHKQVKPGGQGPFLESERCKFKSILSEEGQKRRSLHSLGKCL